MKSRTIYLTQESQRGLFSNKNLLFVQQGNTPFNFIENKKGTVELLFFGPEGLFSYIRRVIIYYIMAIQPGPVISRNGVKLWLRNQKRTLF